MEEGQRERMVLLWSEVVSPLIRRILPVDIRHIKALLVVVHPTILNPHPTTQKQQMKIHLQQSLIPSLQKILLRLLIG